MVSQHGIAFLQIFFFTQLYPGCIFSCLLSTLDSIHHSNFRLEDFKKECDLYYLLQTWIGGINKFEKKENCATIIKSDKIANLRHLQKCIYTKDAFKYKITKCKKNNPWPTHSNKCTYLPIKLRKK